ncbi:MAG: nucleotidyltransferase [Gemmatimonadaceae bacterium]
MSFESMLRGLNDAKIEFVVIGGLAAVAHGAPFVTNDLDVCYRASGENVDRLARLLRTWNAYPRGWEAGLPFELDSRTFHTTPLLTLQTAEGNLDLLDRVAGLDGYETAYEHSIEIEALGVSFRALELGALIRAKEATGRAKDLGQLPALRALLALMEES